MQLARRVILSNVSQRIDNCATLYTSQRTKRHLVSPITNTRYYTRRPNSNDFPLHNFDNIPARSVTKREILGVDRAPFSPERCRGNDVERTNEDDDDDEGDVVDD
ncbi:hypothetical protein Trydic_g5932 [Trypoxylus dichotomus]